MLTYIYFGLIGLVLFWSFQTWSSLQRNIAAAKASGLPYRITLISGIPGFFWTATHRLFLEPLHAYKPSRKWLWPKLLRVHRSWFYAQELRESLGEVYLIVSPSQIYMSSSNAEANNQLTGRRLDFVKPVEIYVIVDIFGPSILTTEGEEWKRHRKIVAPAFSERSNALVWKESLRQTNGMLNIWSKLDGNESNSMKVNDTAPYTATMALHVICAAGFGVRQLWDGEDEAQLGNKVVPGFNTAELLRSHTMTFKDSLNTMLHGILWLVIFPVSLLKKSPFELHKKLGQAYFECKDYFTELSEYKLRQIERGETDEGSMDIMGPLVQAAEKTKEDSNGLYLTKQEVISDSWIALFAGHETSANVTHYCLLFLATELDKQVQLQKDLDFVIGSRPSLEWTYETDLNRIWHSMVGATINETLRVMPPVIDVPKIVRGVPQPLTFGGKKYTVPADTIIHISCLGAQRNPRYWPHAPSKLSTKSHDLDDWVPERWLQSSGISTATSQETAAAQEIDENTTSFDTSGNETLLVPPRGSFLPFSDGARACPGKRFAQVEITATLATIFSKYTCELDVSEWASDAEVRKMGPKEKRTVYEKAMKKARETIAKSESEIFLKMRGTVPVRFVQRGGGLFDDVFV
ncbi:cytochrome P450 monooxygenase-like protein [Mollisia scopiformis]|uniref:Cytochrome P450 monooxygenase-like protein n=1 Tax=Mollisia scopiformis TaxID=149040 RepID=A0A194WZ20_MOLSC|nr:cytochrome P450 monooxygenase-like protein [Mollisia scopiformis]KUJ13200.1 cytochrome P450 monooxygenase-like protein [Mollisia scopiformis]